MSLPKIAGLSNWQWLYLVEALPAIILGFIVLRALTDRPEAALWLRPAERQWLVTTLAAEAAASKSRPGHTSGVWQAMRDPRVLALSLVYLGTSAGLYTLGLWAPLILRQFGLTPIATGWINALPSIAAIAAMIAWARHSDRTLERTWHVVLPCLAACLGFLWAGSTHTIAGIVLAMVLANIGISSAKPPLLAMPTLFLSGASAAAGLAMINSLGNLGGFLGPFLVGWIRSRSGGYAGGLYLVSLTLAVSAAVTLALSRHEDRRARAPAKR